jgi:rubrerythrin
VSIHTEQLQMLSETIAMSKGTSTLHMCHNCGSILYVTSRGDGAKRDWDSPCPVCNADDWVRLSRGQGPFVWGQRT